VALQAPRLESGAARADPGNRATLALAAALAAVHLVKVSALPSMAAAPARRAMRASRHRHARGHGAAGARCVLFGVLQNVVINVIERRAADADRTGAADATARQLPVVHADLAQGASYSAPLVFVAISASRADLAVRAHRRTTTRRSYRGSALRPGERRMQYTATAFSQPIQRIFAPVWDLREDIDEKRHPSQPQIVASIPPGAGARQVLVAAL